MHHNIKPIQSSLNHTFEWLTRMRETYDYADETKAFVLLRATLKAIRDRIPQGEAFHLGSQLPAIVRGFFYEGWDPHKVLSKARTADDFLSCVRMHLAGHEDIDLEMAVPGCMQVIFEKIDKGEADDVLHALPVEVRELCQ